MTATKSTTTTPNPADLPRGALLRLPYMRTLYCVSGASIWRWTKAGTLPAPVRVGGVTAWRAGDVADHLASLKG